MLQVYGFIEEPKLLLHGRGKAVVPTVLAQHLRDTQEGLLVAAVVALHENSKIRLDEADLLFQVRSEDFNIIREPHIKIVMLKKHVITCTLVLNLER